MATIEVDTKKIAFWAAPVIITIGLVGILALHLAAAYITGMFAFHGIRVIARRLPRHWSPRLARWLALVIFLTVVSVVITVLLRWGAGRVLAVFADPGLWNTLALGWQRFLNSLPVSMTAYLPISFDELRVEVVDFLNKHWGTVGAVSRAGFHTIVVGLVGFIVGVLIAFERQQRYRGFADNLAREVARVARAFWEVISAQVLISFINTTLTALYLIFVLPAFDVHLPYLPVLVIVTFIAGLMPVLGNLISNTIIVLTSFTVSVQVGAGSLAFLILIHKLEYFMNAKIIGMQIHAKPWELLIAFFVGDAAFGLPGLMVAPFFYGYYKLLMKEYSQPPITLPVANS